NIADYLTVAYDATTGHPLWIRRLDIAHGDGDGFAYYLRVSPDGTRVYVTGHGNILGGTYDYTTMALDASSGTLLWLKRFDLARFDDFPRSLAVSPDGQTVYVTGYGGVGDYGDTDYLTLAYDAVSGTLRWAQTYNGPANDADIGDAVGVSPDSA